MLLVVFSPKGWHIIAQGNALGFGRLVVFSPKGWHIIAQGNALGFGRQCIEP